MLIAIVNGGRLRYGNKEIKKQLAWFGLFFKSVRILFLFF